MNGKTVSAQARVEGVNHSITTPKGRAFRFRFARQRQSDKNRGYCNRCTPLSDGKHEPRNSRCPIDVL
jgi:hypothetical protein